MLPLGKLKVDDPCIAELPKSKNDPRSTYCNSLLNMLSKLLVIKDKIDLYSNE